MSPGPKLIDLLDPKPYFLEKQKIKVQNIEIFNDLLHIIFVGHINV